MLELNLALDQLADERFVDSTAWRAGTLRIYLGAAPGVGKTFAMLNEGWRGRDRGTDVVVGYVETHGRPSTAEQIGELEVVPRRKHRRTAASTFEEMDVDAILARQPERGAGRRARAHERARVAQREAVAGRRGAARRRHRRDLHRQHPAPRVGERRRRADHRASSSARRCPTRSCARADQIELVDMTPEALRRRMAHGNIYTAREGRRRARPTTSGSATSPRSASSRCCGSPTRSTKRCRSTGSAHGITEQWETRERVVVAVTGAPGGEHLIRRAARMAQRPTAS